MTGPTGTAPPLEGNQFLIKNEINCVLHPYPLCERLLYLFGLIFPFPCGKEKALYEGSSHAWQTLVLALDNMGIKTEFHQTEEQAHSLKKQSDSREGGTFEAILKLRIQRPIN